MIRKSLIITLLFLLIYSVMTMNAVKAESAADDSQRSYEGNAYVVVTADKELIFFRSENEYDEHYSEITAEDILGNTYTGKVYRIDETGEIISVSPWYSEQDNIISARVADGQAVKPATLRGMFLASSSLVSADLRGFDTSDITDMALMFADCTSLKSVNLEGLDTSGVTDMSDMFGGCESLEELDLRVLNTSSVTDLSSMFSDCEALRSLDISSFDTRNVTDFHHMFGYCRNLKEKTLFGMNRKRF